MELFSEVSFIILSELTVTGVLSLPAQSSIFPVTLSSPLPTSPSSTVLPSSAPFFDLLDEIVEDESVEGEEYVPV